MSPRLGWTSTYTLDHVYVEEDLYRRGLDALSALVAEGKVRLIVGAQSLQFEIVDEAALAAYDFTASQLYDVVDDVVDVLLAAVNRFSEEGFVERRSNERPEMPEVTPEDPDLARRKFEMTTGAFDLPSLRERRWLKRTAKVDLPHSLDWEIGEKSAASSRLRRDDERPGLRLGVIRVATEDIGHHYLPTYHQVTFAVDREDLDFMIDRLIAMRAAWSKIESGSDA